MHLLVLAHALLVWQATLPGGVVAFRLSSVLRLLFGCSPELAVRIYLEERSAGCAHVRSLAAVLRHPTDMQSALNSALDG